MISGVRIFGLVFGVCILIYVSYMRREARLRKGECIVGLLIFVAAWTVALYPPAGDVLTSLFQVEGRLFAIAILSSFVLFILFMYLLAGQSEMRRSFGDLVRALAITKFERENTYGSSEPLIAVIIPAYNEEKSIASVLDQIPDQILGMRVRTIVVIDGALDRTGDVVQQRGNLAVFHAVNRGQGDALRTGFEIAFRERAEIIITMDGDGQHRPDEIDRLVSPIIDGEADYVMGSRFLGQYSDRGGARHIGILIFSVILSLVAGMRITDCTNGFRAIRASTLTHLELRESRFSASELILEAVNKGLRIKEVPVSILSRKKGASKKPGGLGYPVRFAFAILRVWLRS